MRKEIHKEETGLRDGSNQREANDMCKLPESGAWRMECGPAEWKKIEEEPLGRSR